jgi:hypothetical protein
LPLLDKFPSPVGGRQRNSRATQIYLSLTLPAKQFARLSLLSMKLAQSYITANLSMFLSSLLHLLQLELGMTMKPMQGGLVGAQIRIISF